MRTKCSAPSQLVIIMGGDGSPPTKEADEPLKPWKIHCAHCIRIGKLGRFLRTILLAWPSSESNVEGIASTDARVPGLIAAFKKHCKDNPGDDADKALKKLTGDLKNFKAATHVCRSKIVASKNICEALKPGTPKTDLSGMTAEEKAAHKRKQCAAAQRKHA